MYRCNHVHLALSYSPCVLVLCSHAHAKQQLAFPLPRKPQRPASFALKYFAKALEGGYTVELREEEEHVGNSAFRASCLADYPNTSFLKIIKMS